MSKISFNNCSTTAQKMEFLEQEGKATNTQNRAVMQEYVAKYHPVTVLKTTEAYKSTVTDDPTNALLYFPKTDNPVIEGKGLSIYEDENGLYMYGYSKEIADANEAVKKDPEKVYFSNLLMESDILTEGVVKEIKEQFVPLKIGEEVDKRPVSEVVYEISEKELNNYTQTEISGFIQRFRTEVFDSVFRYKIGKWEELYRLKKEIIDKAKEGINDDTKSTHYFVFMSKYFDIFLENEFKDVFTVDREKQDYKIAVTIEETETEIDEDEEGDHEYSKNQLFVESNKPLKVTGFMKILFGALKGTDGKRYTYPNYVIALSELQATTLKEFREKVDASHSPEIKIIKEYLYGLKGIIASSTTTPNPLIKDAFSPIASNIETALQQIATSNKPQIHANIIKKDKTEQGLEVLSVFRTQGQKERLNSIVSIVNDKDVLALLRAHTGLKKKAEDTTKTAEEQAVAKELYKESIVNLSKVLGIINSPDATVLINEISAKASSSKDDNPQRFSRSISQDSDLITLIQQGEALQANNTLTVSVDGKQVSVLQRSNQLNTLPAVSTEYGKTDTFSVGTVVETNRFKDGDLARGVVRIDNTAYLQSGYVLNGFKISYAGFTDLEMLKTALEMFNKGRNIAQTSFLIQTITQSDQSTPVATQISFGSRFFENVSLNFKDENGKPIAFDSSNNAHWIKVLNQRTFKNELNYWGHTLRNMFAHIGLPPYITLSEMVEELSKETAIPEGISVNQLQARLGRNYISVSKDGKTFSLNPDLKKYLNALDTQEGFTSELDKMWEETLLVIKDRYAAGVFSADETDQLKLMHYLHAYTDRVINPLLVGDMFSYKGNNVFKKVVDRFKRSKQSGGIGLAETAFGLGETVSTIALTSFSSSKLFKNDLPDSNTDTRIHDVFGNEVKDFKAVDGQSFMSPLQARLMRESFGGDLQDYFKNGLDTKTLITGMLGNHTINIKDSTLTISPNIYRISTPVQKAIYRLMYSRTYATDLTDIQSSIDFVVDKVIKDHDKRQGLKTHLSENPTHNNAWELLRSINIGLGNNNTSNEILQESEDLLYYLTIVFYLQGGKYSDIKEKFFSSVSNIENIKANNGIELKPIDDSFVFEDGNIAINNATFDDYQYSQIPTKNIKIQLNANHDIAHSAITLMTQAVNVMGIQGRVEKGKKMKEIIKRLTDTIVVDIPLLKDIPEEELNEELTKILLQTIEDKDNLMQKNEILASEDGSIVFLPYYSNLLSNKLNTYINKAIKPKIKGDLFVLRQGTNMIQVYDWQVATTGETQSGLYDEYQSAMSKGHVIVGKPRTLKNDGILYKGKDIRFPNKYNEEEKDTITERASEILQGVASKTIDEQVWLDFIDENSSVFTVRPFEVVLPNNYRKELPFVQQLGLNASQAEIKQWYDKAGKEEDNTELAHKKYLELQSIKEVIVNRIPTTGLHSSGYSKIVGFHNDNSNTIFIPDGIMYIQGSDLDIDKGVTVLRDLKTKDKTGNDKQSIKEANSILDTFIDVLSKPRSYNEAHTPVTTNEMDEVKTDLMEELSDEDKRFMNFNPYRTFMDMIAGNWLNGGGKTQVGVYANSQKVYNNVFYVCSTLIEEAYFAAKSVSFYGQSAEWIRTEGRKWVLANHSDAKIKQVFNLFPAITFQSPILVEATDGGKANTIGNIFQPRSKNQVWASQSGASNSAMDNAKDPKLAIIGSTSVTSPLIGAAMMLGGEDSSPIHYSFLKFFADPITKAIVKNKGQATDKMTAEFEKDPASKGLVAKYLKDYKALEKWAEFSNGLAKLLKINQGAPFQTVDLLIFQDDYDTAMQAKDGRIKIVMDNLPEFSNYFKVMNSNTKSKSKLFKDVALIMEYFRTDKNIIASQKTNTDDEAETINVNKSARTRDHYKSISKAVSYLLLASSRVNIAIDYNGKKEVFEINSKEVLDYQGNTVGSKALEDFGRRFPKMIKWYLTTNSSLYPTLYDKVKLDEDVIGKDETVAKAEIKYSSTLDYKTQLALQEEFQKMPLEWQDALYMYSAMKDGESFGKHTFTSIFGGSVQRQRTIDAIRRFDIRKVPDDYMMDAIRKISKGGFRLVFNTQPAVNASVVSIDSSLSKNEMATTEAKTKMKGLVGALFTKLFDFLNAKGVVVHSGNSETLKAVFIAKGGTEAMYNNYASSAKGFTFKNEIYINPFEDSENVLLTRAHEYAHIFLQMLKHGGKEANASYVKLLEQVKEARGEFKESIDKVNALYEGELEETSEDYWEEVLVQELERIAKLEIEKKPVEITPSIQDARKSIWQAIRAFFTFDFSFNTVKANRKGVSAEETLLSIVKSLHRYIGESTKETSLREQYPLKSLTKTETEKVRQSKQDTERPIGRFTNQDTLTPNYDYVLLRERYMKDLNPKLNAALIKKLEANKTPESIRIILENAGLISSAPTVLALSLFDAQNLKEKDQHRVNRIFQHSSKLQVERREIRESPDPRFKDVLYAVKTVNGVEYIDLIGCLSVVPLTKTHGSLTKFSSFTSFFQNNIRDAKMLELAIFALYLKTKYPKAVFGTMKVAQIANNLDKAEDVHIKDANQVIREFQRMGKDNKDKYTADFLATLKDKDLIEAIQSIDLVASNYLEIYKQEFAAMGANLEKTDDKVAFVRKRKSEIRNTTVGFSTNEEYILLSRLESELIGLDMQGNKVIDKISRWLKSSSDFTNEIVQYVQNLTKKAFDNIAKEYWSGFRKVSDLKTAALIVALRKALPELQYGTIKGYREYYKHLWETDTNGIKTGRLINPVTSPTVNPSLWSSKWSHLLKDKDIIGYIEWYKDTLAEYKTKMYQREEGINRSPISLLGDEYFIPLVNAKWSQQLFQNGKIVKAFNEVTAVINDYDRISGKQLLTDNLDKDLYNHFVSQSLSKDIYFNRIGLQRLGDNTYAVQEGGKVKNESTEIHLENLLNLFVMTEMKQSHLKEVAEVYDTVLTILKAENNPDLDYSIRFFTDQYQRVILNHKNLDNGLFDKITSALGSVATYFGIGFNMTTAVHQMAQGQWNLWNNAFSGVMGVDNAVSMKACAKAFGIMTTATGGNIAGTIFKIGGYNGQNTKTVEKVEALSKHFRLLDMDYSRITGNQYSLTGNFASDLPFIGLNAGDYFNKMQYFIAKMIDDGSWDAYNMTKVNKDGKKVKDSEEGIYTLFYDESKDRRLKENPLFRAYLVEQGLEVDGKLTDGYSYEMANKIRRLSDILFGTFSKEDQNNLNSYAFFRLILAFRRWVVPKIMRYWNGRTFDNKELGNLVNKDGKMVWEGTFSEGIFMSIGSWMYNINKAFKQDGMGISVFPKAWGELNKTQQDNIYRGATDLVMFIALVSMMMLAEPDPEERSRRRGIWKKIYDLTADFTIANDPSQVLAIIKSPITLVTYLERLLSIFTLGLFTGIEGATGFDILTDRQVKQRLKGVRDFGGLFVPLYKDYRYWEEMMDDK